MEFGHSLSNKIVGINYGRCKGVKAIKILFWVSGGGLSTPEELFVGGAGGWRPPQIYFFSFIREILHFLMPFFFLFCLYLLFFVPPIFLPFPFLFPFIHFSPYSIISPQRRNIFLNKYPYTPIFYKYGLAKKYGEGRILGKGIFWIKRRKGFENVVMNGNGS